MNLSIKGIALLLSCIASVGCIDESTSIEDLSSAPKAASFSIETNEDESVEFSLLVTDRENNVSEYFLEEPPENGIISGQYPNLNYTPNTDFNGHDEFKYKVTDGSFDSNIATGSITILPVNDKPTISGEAQREVKAYGLFSFTPVASDVEYGNLTFSINVIPNWATFDPVTGRLEGVPDNNQVGIYSNIIISVTDGTLDTKLSPFSVEVLANPWESKALLLNGRHGATSNLVDQKIYVIGGFGGNSLHSVEVYDPLNNLWTNVQSMPTARRIHSSTTVNGKIYAIGGESGTVLSAVEEYDPELNRWTTKESIPTARSAHASCEVNNKIYVFGGFKTTSHSDSTAAVEEYDPLTNLWKTKTSMTTKRWGMVCYSIDDKIFLFGGAGSGTLVEIYDPTLDTWAVGPSMLAGFRYGSAIAASNQKIYIFGGHDSQSTVQEFDPTTRVWQLKSIMPTQRYDVSGITLDNEIFLIGGRNNSSNSLSIVESYSPSSDH